MWPRSPYVATAASPTTASQFPKPVAVAKSIGAGQSKRLLKSSDANPGPWGDVSEPEPDPAENLRIPQKGYRVHLAVSPNP